MQYIKPIIVAALCVSSVSGFAQPAASGSAMFERLVKIQAQLPYTSCKDERGYKQCTKSCPSYPPLNHAACMYGCAKKFC